MGVYVITDGTAVKIGVGDPKQRIKQLQTGNPREITLVREINTPLAYALERKMHQIYSDYRIRGEWFSAEILDDISGKSDADIMDNVALEAREQLSAIQRVARGLDDEEIKSFLAYLGQGMSQVDGNVKKYLLAIGIPVAREFDRRLGKAFDTEVS